MASAGFESCRHGRQAHPVNRTDRGIGGALGHEHIRLRDGLYRERQKVGGRSIAGLK